MSESSVIGVDLAKSVFEVAVSPEPGRITERLRLSWSQWVRWVAQRQPATVVMECCGTAHYWARQLSQLGHRPVLLPARQVRAYVSGNKTDRADAAALLEALRNESIRPVPAKSRQQQVGGPFIACVRPGSRPASRG